MLHPIQASDAIGRVAGLSCSAPTALGCRSSSLCPSHAKQPRIVNDLIPIILESNDHWWPKDLQRLALVSPSWVGPIRRRLYDCPKLQTFRAFTLFVNAVTANPHLLPLIQGLELRPSVEDGFAVSDQDMASLGFLLTLKGLRTVTLGGELAVHSERFIHMMTDTRTISSLHIDGSDILRRCGGMTTPHIPSLSWDDSIAFRFSRSLRSLRLTNLHLSLADSAIPYGMRVHSLTLEEVSVDAGFIDDLLHESWEHLKHLDISSSTPQTSDDMVASLLECCENLESLSYEGCGGATHGEFLEEDLPGLTALKQLRLYDIDINEQSLALVAQTCRGLTELSVLGRMLRLPAQGWVQFLKSGALPALRVLQTPPGNNQPPAGFFRWPQQTCNDLRSACDARGVCLSHA
ncbi:hypothetical protein PHLGIDRAFT_32865 [Phlebiopsis gigantea 11061_1 CR5-6]|uniref:F-box domain-containing protein n=1 Tax=Phlebiopsis gigantea (strain 11061_1 CR5-6) TaxID=745531 RepID=A0A0C3SEC5_PHLG1|nr:hypothetical protein PHLGIDRAFT_32865 [Phlebiopsis gigantea 11061_1 CR5-6]